LAVAVRAITVEAQLDDGSLMITIGLDPAFGHLYLSVRMGHHQLDPPRVRTAPVTRLGMRRNPVVDLPCPLAVPDERLSHGPEDALLGVTERADGAIGALSLAGPGPEKEAELGHIEMQGKGPRGPGLVGHGSHGTARMGPRRKRRVHAHRSGTGDGRNHR
jgi:hypothetical protein